MQPKFDALYRALVTSYDSGGKIRVQCPQVAGLAEIRSAEPANPKMPIPAIGTTVWIGFSGGDITKPYYFSNSSFIQNSNDTTFLSILSQTNVLPDGLAEYFVSGQGGQNTGGSGPFLKIQDTLGTSAADFYLSGSVIKTNNSGTPYTWQTAAIFGSWAQGSGVGGSYPNLQWRYDAENNIHIHGTFHSTTSAPGGVIATGLPAVSIAGNVGVGGAAVGVNVTNRTMPVYVNGSGELRSALNGTIAVNDTFMLNAKIPIGTIS